MSRWDLGIDVCYQEVGRDLWIYYPSLVSDAGPLGPSENVGREGDEEDGVCNQSAGRDRDFLLKDRVYLGSRGRGTVYSSPSDTLAG